MTKNKRYERHYDEIRDEHIARMTFADSEPRSLQEAQLELDRLPLTTSPVPIPVRAWVRFSSGKIQVDAEAWRWTSKAVGIRFVTPQQVEYRIWVRSEDVTVLSD